MIGDKIKFVSLEVKEWGFVTYEDNNKEKFLGIGNIENWLTTSIENLLCVEGLKHNLLSISTIYLQHALGMIIDDDLIHKFLEANQDFHCVIDCQLV